LTAACKAVHRRRHWTVNKPFWFHSQVACMETCMAWSLQEYDYWLDKANKRYEFLRWRWRTTGANSFPPRHSMLAGTQSHPFVPLHSQPLRRPFTRPVSQLRGNARALQLSGRARGPLRNPVLPSSTCWLAHRAVSRGWERR